MRCTELVEGRRIRGMSRMVPVLPDGTAARLKMVNQILIKLLHFIRIQAFVGDFCLKPELVNEKTRFYLTDVFRKIIYELNMLLNYSTKEIHNY